MTVAYEQVGGSQETQHDKGGEIPKPSTNGRNEAGVSQTAASSIMIALVGLVRQYSGRCYHRSIRQAKTYETIMTQLVDFRSVIRCK